LEAEGDEVAAYEDVSVGFGTDAGDVFAKDYYAGLSFD
jgi:hypothetical protein